MRQRGITLAAIAIGLATAPAQANEPLAFKGMTLGAPATAITQDPRFDCRNVKTPTADLVCTLRPKQLETLAGAPLISLYYFFDRARLTGVTANLPESQFETVRTALETKYGIATIHTETIKTLSGKSFENRTLSWQASHGKLELQRYAGQVNRSLLRLTDEQAATRIRERQLKPASQDI